MHSCWSLDPRVRIRRLGHSAVVYHEGSGDTLLVSQFAGDVLDILAFEDSPRSVEELLERVSEDTNGHGLGDVLAALAEAGIVRGESIH